MATWENSREKKTLSLNNAVSAVIIKDKRVPAYLFLPYLPTVKVKSLKSIIHNYTSHEDQVAVRLDGDESANTLSHLGRR